MISADGAKEATRKAKVFKELKALEKNIESAIKNGRDFAISLGTMEPENVEKLRELGYKVEAQARGFKITW